MPARRILAFFLCFILGFLSCIGALIGGGYFIYSKVSLDWLDDKGLLPIDPGQYLDPDAEVDLSELTLQDMVAEVGRLAALSEPITVEALIDRYGLILPASAEKLLPAGLRTVPVGELFSAKGLEHILKNTRVDYILGLLPEGVVSEPAQQALGEKTLFEVVDQKMETLLSGVQLGYLLGVEYEKDEDGSYVPVYADPERPTPIETLATVDLGKLLGIVGGGGDLLTIMEKCLGDVAVEMLLSSVVGFGGSSMSSIFGELTVDDLLYYDEASGGYLIDLAKVLDGRRVGELLGCTPTFSEQNPGVILAWHNANGEEIFGLARALAGIVLSIEDGMLPSLEVLAADCKLGDMMGYYPTIDPATGEITAWTDAAGKKVGGIELRVADLMIGNLTGGNFSFASTFGDLYLGEMMKYEKREVGGEIEWWENVGEGSDKKKVTGLAAKLASYPLSDLIEGRIDLSADGIAGDLMIGEVIGYEPCYTDGVDGEGNPIKVLTDWRDSAGNSVPVGTMRAIAHITVGELDDPEKGIDSVLIGDILGYIKVLSETTDGNGNPVTETVWYERYDAENLSDPEKTKLADGIMVAFAGLSIGDMKDADKVSEQVKSIKVGDAMGYTYKDGVWYSVYTETEKKLLDGVLLAIADKTIGELDDPEKGIDSVLIGDILGYTKVLRETTDGNGNPVTETVWYERYDAENLSDPEKTKLADGIMVAFAGLSVGDLKDADKVSVQVKSIKVCDVMGYTYKDGVWYSVYTETEKKPLSGVMKMVADSEIGALEATLNDAHMGDILGYTITDGWWYKENGVKTSALVNTISSSRLEELGATMDGLTIKDMFDENERKSGFLSLVPEDTKVTDAGKTINDIFAKTQMWQFVGCVRSGEGTVESPYVYTPQYDENDKTTGVLVFTKATVNNLDKIDLVLGGSWKTWTISGFVEYISGIVNS